MFLWIIERVEKLNESGFLSTTEQKQKKHMISDERQRIHAYPLFY